MNYDEMMKQGRLDAVRAFFRMHGYYATADYLNWFYENFLGICKNMGYMYSNNEPLTDSPYADFALQIYALGH